VKRREFFRFSAAAASALTFSPLPTLLSGRAELKRANDIVVLGRTGIRVSRLAMGTGTNGVNRRSNQTDRLGVRGLADLLHAAHEQGVHFWDSADQYGTHPHLKEALKGIPREKTVILTKTHATTAAEMRADLDRFRKEIGTEYLDIVLLHMMTDADWPRRKQGAMEVLARAREDGIVRAHGVSCHTFEALEAAANSDWVQVDLARINPEGVSMDAGIPSVVRVLQRMHRDGKGIIGMKVFGGGRLRHQADECLQYVLGLDCVDAFTIGQESRREMEDLLTRIPGASVAEREG
jgi:aryl-alcohol dehydrogenase-like predicted oxidoreductase